MTTTLRHNIRTEEQTIYKILDDGRYQFTYQIGRSRAKTKDELTKEELKDIQDKHIPPYDWARVDLEPIVIGQVTVPRSFITDIIKEQIGN